MRILGLNGWAGRGHDGAACLVVDGKVEFFAEEERYVRDKHAYGRAPVHAVAAALHRAGIGLEDIDLVGFGWDTPTLYTDRGQTWPHDEASALEALLPHGLFPRRRDPRLVFVPHHLAHAASAYHVSGDPEAAILVLDGQGENESASLAVGHHGKIEILETVPVSWSLGYFYDAVGQFSGLGRDQAGKLMGLAAFGEVREDLFDTFRFDTPRYRVDAIDPGLRSTTTIDDSAESTAAWWAYLEKVTGMSPNPQSRVYDPAVARFVPRSPHDPFDYRDLAASAQHLIERAVDALTDQLFRLTSSRVLHIAGGVGFNASLNGRLLRRPDVERLFVQPVAGDAGVALGAAVHLAAEHGEIITPFTGSLAMGDSFGSGEVRDVIESSGLAFEEPSDITEAVADLVAADRIVGWAQGAGEVGPRALGHRSVVANPAEAATRDRINLQIKRREWWRPLAPSMQVESFREVIDAPAELPYMVVTTPLRDDMVQRVAAVNHVDNTTRPQTVSAADDPLYHRLLGAVGERTGLPVVLNTSFNGNDEPIVWTPQDALRTYSRLGLDALAMGPFLIRKR
jgi:predicted NodU family carbamoyl transferase